ncbi:MAG: site-specific integrase [Oscillospiraceae bacterium]|jgi:integrase|nr:site-specific integrase [Oscillospiraceae bacterium]
MPAPPKYTYYRSTFYHNGKQYSARGKTQREADRKADQKLSAMERGEVATGGDVAVKKWAQMWLDTYRASSIGVGQYKNYVTYIKTISAAIGEKRMNDVTPEDVQNLLNSQAGKSKSYVRHLQHTIQAIFKRARISRHILYDPAEGLITPTAYEHSRRSITEDERAAILPLAETHRAGLWIKTILYCGLRPGETRALDWRHIDLDGAILHVELAAKAVTGLIDEPKTAAGIRSIPIPAPLLKSFRQAQGAPDEAVFRQPTTNRRHTKISMSCLWKNFKRELDISLGAELYRNKIIVSKVAPDLVPYCLRHTYSTDLQTAGVPLNIAKYLMGHTDIKMTANVYTHTANESIITAGKMLDNYYAQEAFEF